MSVRLTPHDLYPFQHKGVAHGVYYPHAMFTMDMSAGKTIITLNLRKYLKQYGWLKRTIVVAPLRPAKSVWKKEALTWSNTNDLTFSFVLGSKEKRTQALFTDADVYLINYENVQWLVTHLEHHYLSQGKQLPFQMLVLDESTWIKRSTAKRSRALYRIHQYFTWRVGLTGTIASKGLIDLFGQYLLIDGGARLGTSKTAFESRYFHKEGFKMIPYDFAMGDIVRRVADITMDLKVRDHVQMPDVKVVDIRLDLPEPLMEKYTSLEEDFFFQLDNGIPIEVMTKGAVTNKLLQFAAGAVYLSPESQEYEVVHDLKLEALEEIYEGTGGDSILLGYQYASDFDRIKKKYPDAIKLSGLTHNQADKVIEDWNEGRIKLLCGHPRSMGHGLNMQFGGHHIAWFGLNWSSELYRQFIARLVRQGQKYCVMVHRILMSETFDLVQHYNLIENLRQENRFRDLVSAANMGKQEERIANLLSLPPEAEEKSLARAVSNYRQIKQGQMTEDQMYYDFR